MDKEGEVSPGLQEAMKTWMAGRTVGLLCDDSNGAIKALKRSQRKRREA